ncbi:MAG: hypothetical protein DHS80DRAFT_22844 [Piptocephalis tieghemiana]|nr:MAG: hypothetical protein DHS80DRAFT_22844 [Piptocephalis tieghemiana]
MLFAKLAPTLLFLLLPTSLYATDDVEMREASTQRPSVSSSLMAPFVYSCSIRSRVSPFSVLDLLLRYPSEIPKLFGDIQSLSRSADTNLADNAQKLESCFRHLEREARNLPYYAAFIGNGRFPEPEAVELQTLGISLQMLLKALLDQDPSRVVYERVHYLEHHVKHYWEKTSNAPLTESLSWKWSKRVSGLIDKHQSMLPSFPPQTPLLRPQPISSCVAEFFFLNLYPYSQEQHNMKTTCLNNHLGKAISLISSAKTFTFLNTGQISIPFTLVEIQGFLMDYIHNRKIRKQDTLNCTNERSKCNQWYKKIKEFAESMAFAPQDEDLLVLATALTHLDENSRKAVSSIDSYNFVPICEGYKVDHHWRLISNALRFLRLRIWGKSTSHSTMDLRLLQEVKRLFSTLSEAVREVSNDETKKRTSPKDPSGIVADDILEEHRRLTAKLYSQMASLAEIDPFSPDIMSDNVFKREFTEVTPIIMNEIEDVNDASLDKSLLLLTGSVLSPTDVGSRKISSYRSFFKHLARIAYDVRLTDGARWRNGLVSYKLPQLNQGIQSKWK